MPLTITKRDGKFCVTDPAGKTFGCHATKQGAVDQIGAIESNKSKSGLEVVAGKRIELLSAELDASHGTEQPPIMVMSDGTPEGTTLMVNGMVVPFKRMDICCSQDPDYPYCDLSITLVEGDQNGLQVEKTLRLRKEPPSEVALKGAQNT